MRPVLFSLGPWEPWAYPLIVAAVAVFVYLWRRLQVRLGEPPAPLNWRNGALTAIVVLVAAALIYVVVNRFAPVEIKSYGLMLVLAFAAGIVWLAHTAPPEEYSLADILDFSLVVLVGSIVGARLVFWAMNLPEYAGDPSGLMKVWEGGLSFHGGVAGAMASSGVYCWWRRKSFLRLADLTAPSIALGYAITRVGCFLNGCCYGAPVPAPWGVCFPEVDHPCVLRHPAQLYASAANALIFGVLAFIARRPMPGGALFLVYLLLYSVYRFAIEIVRRDASAVVYEPLSPLTIGQVASILIALAASAALAIVYALAARRRRRSHDGSRGV